MNVSSIPFNKDNLRPFVVIMWHDFYRGHEHLIAGFGCIWIIGCEEGMIPNVPTMGFMPHSNNLLRRLSLLKGIRIIYCLSKYS